MKPHVVIGRALSPDGTELELVEHDGDFVLNADRTRLMTTRLTLSEIELARLVCEDLDEGATVLIGGLGLGFTLRTALDLLPEGGRAVQVELVPEIIEWNRGPVAHCANHPLDDPRCVLVQDDVAMAVLKYDESLAAIMLDVDNGPSPLVVEKNASLYEPDGLAMLRAALEPGGALAIWASDEDKTFPRRFERAGFDVTVHRIPARTGEKNRIHHVVYVGRKPGGRRRRPTSPSDEVIPVDPSPKRNKKSRRR